MWAWHQEKACRRAGGGGDVAHDQEEDGCEGLS